MSGTNIKKNSSYARLKSLAAQFEDEAFHLKHLLKNKNRLESCSIMANDFFFDFSRQRVNPRVLDSLVSLAKETKAREQFKQMTEGGRVNTTEQRAALHTATRDFSSEEVMLDQVNVSSLLQAEHQKVKNFSDKIRNRTLCNAKGKPFTDAVVIGIGGSYLGCEFVYHAIRQSVTPLLNLHFLANVDIDNFGQIIKKIDPETCLWIVVSKSYTTTETLANLNQALGFLNRNGLEPDHHLVTITAKGSPGDNTDNPVLKSFVMYDFIGGRYSVSSAVGAVPLSLAFGFDVFESFLKGCYTMDRHALNSTEERNIPLLAALISIWNSNFLNYSAQAIIPYTSSLAKLAPHVQQLYMESIGKCVTRDGVPVDYPTGVIIFGEPGTNAQHSFFQLAHQGQPFPVEFIGVVNAIFEGNQAMSKGVFNHQELWANMIAQSQALALGQQNQDPARQFSGNRPSSTVIINDLSPKSIGTLLSFYEARTVFEGFILGINPFDQFGVELGKVLAGRIRSQIEQKNRDHHHTFETDDPISRFYLETLFKKSL